VQLIDLKQKYDKPLVIVQGEEDIYNVRQIHPNAIRGMLATIAVSYGIPILQTKNSIDTAMLLMIIAKREQEQHDKEFNVHGSKKPMTLKEQQEYIISALPGIGPSLAKPLLKEFKSVKKIINANEKDLKKIKLIGDKKSKSIRRALDSEYSD
jgi:Fanconi anemia group M protein